MRTHIPYGSNFIPKLFYGRGLSEVKTSVIKYLTAGSSPLSKNFAVNELSYVAFDFVEDDF